jgi:exonuclease SbcD
MKTLVCGDCHIGAVFSLGKSNGSGGNTRVDDYEKTLNYIVDYTISNGIDVFIQTGDLFEVRNPTTEHMHIADRAIKKLSDANVFSIFIMGNHDYKKTGETYTSALSTMQANSYPNVRILLQPEVISYATKSGEQQSMLLLPYRDKRMYPGIGSKETTDLFNEHIKSLASKMIDDCPKIAVGHNFFFDGNYFDFGGHEVLASPDSFVGVDVVIMGHHHEFREVRKNNPKSFYSGSMERTNFGDAKVDKFVLIFDSETKEVSKHKIPVKDLEDISLDMTASTSIDYLENFKSGIKNLDLKGKICRVSLKIKDGTQSIFSRSDIEKVLYELGASHVSKILWDVNQLRLEKDKSILEKKSDFEIFEAFLNTQSLESSMLHKMLEEAKKIMV